MRAVKTVITAAGNLKQAEPDGDEMVLLLRALQARNTSSHNNRFTPLFLFKLSRYRWGIFFCFFHLVLSGTSYAAQAFNASLFLALAL